MLAMTNAPTPTAIPAMAPGLRLELLRLDLVDGGADGGVVVLVGFVDVSPNGTPITEASDDA